MFLTVNRFASRRNAEILIEHGFSVYYIRTEIDSAAHLTLSNEFEHSTFKYNPITDSKKELFDLSKRL